MVRLEVLDTEEKEQAFRLAEIALSMKYNNPASKLWRMRVRQALDRMEKLWKISRPVEVKR